MRYADTLLMLANYPEPTPSAAVDQALAFCAAFSSGVTAAAFRVDIPLKSNRVADMLIGLSSMAKEEEARSAANAQAVLQRFTSEASKLGIHDATICETVRLYDADRRAAALARTYDLCVVPVTGPMDGQRGVAETVIFGAGRPVIFLPVGTVRSAGFDNVAIAWDGSPSAARAVGDAMPILQVSKHVRILTVLGEKDGVPHRAPQDLMRHLARHGVSAVVDELSAAGERIGKVFSRYAEAQSLHLLVMGAFGHSRVREFVLGGATESMMEHPPVPILFSH